MPEKPDIQPVSKQKVSDQVAEQLATQILTGRFETGQRLPPERDLSSMLSVSRLCLREALSAIEGMGLIETVQGGGSYVCDVRDSANLKVLDIGFPVELHSSGVFISEILDLRVALLRAIIPMAVERIEDNDLAELKKAMQAALTAVDLEPRRQAELDFAFFQRLVWATHSRVMTLLVNSIKKIFIQVTANLNRSFSGNAKVTQRKWYEELVVHIAHGDADAAVAFAEKILNQEKQGLIKAGIIAK